MNVLILGDGLMARAIGDAFLDRFLGTEGPTVYMIAHAAVDLRSQDSIVALLREYQPDVAINTVAKHTMSWCEQNATETFDVNAKGAARVARLVPTVYLSSDYVWGEGGPHDESLPGRQPRSVYGRSKLAGELETLEHDGIVVRISGVFHPVYESHKGPSFPEMMATRFEPISLPSDQVFSPTYAPDAAARIVDLALALAEKKAQGIYHAANSGSTSWSSFGREITRILGRRVPKITTEVQHDGLRPTNSALRSTRLPPLRHWQPALEEWAVKRQARLVETRVSPLRESSNV